MVDIEISKVLDQTMHSFWLRCWDYCYAPNPIGVQMNSIYPKWQMLWCTRTVNLFLEHHAVIRIAFFFRPNVDSVWGPECDFYN